MKALSIIIFCFSVSISFGQNDLPNREASKLELALDSIEFYSQDLEESPYFVTENVLQIFPGEELFIEAEVSDLAFTSMKIVRENLHPKKTIILKFDQNMEGRIHSNMMVSVTNPFSSVLKYSALMYLVGHDKWIETSIVPIRAELTGIEMWNDVIISLVLKDWTLEEGK